MVLVMVQCVPVLNVLEFHLKTAVCMRVDVWITNTLYFLMCIMKLFSEEHKKSLMFFQ